MTSYFQSINDALKNSDDNKQTWLSIANGTASKSPMEDSAENKILLAEGYKPVLKPNKEWEWVKPKKTPADLIQNYQKVMSSVSPELMSQLVPVMQYYEKNALPMIDRMVQDVHDDKVGMSEQYLIEQIYNMTHGDNLKTAIKNTGGMKEQMVGPLAKTGSSNQTGSLLASSPSAAKYLSYVSKYAQNGYTNVSGGDDE